MFLKNRLTDSIISPCATILFQNKYYYKTSVLEHITVMITAATKYRLRKHYRDFFIWIKVEQGGGKQKFGSYCKANLGSCCDRWRIMHQYGKGVLKCSNSTSILDALNYKYSSMKIV